MTARSSNIGFIGWEAEDSFADTADDTYTTVIQIRDDMIDFGNLEEELIDRGGTYQRLNERDQYALGAFGLGTFTVTLDATGMGSTAVGSLTEPNLAKLLGHVFGNSDWTGVGDNNLTASGSDADTIAGADAATLALGSLIRAGVLGDTRAEGQAAAIGIATSDNTTPLELDTALPGTVGDGDDLFAMGMIYPGSNSGNTDILTSDASSDNNTLRFVLATENLAYVVRGCACTNVTLQGTSPGEMPQWVLEFSGVAWEPITVTIPSATAIADKASVPNSAGSFFVQTQATTTRALLAPMEVEITIGQGMVPVQGTGGENNRQNMVGWRRVPAPTTVAVTIEAEAQTASPAYELTANPTVIRHGLYTFSTVDGSALAMYWPRLLQITHPTMIDWNGLRARRIQFLAATNNLTTNESELTMSCWRLGMA